MLSNQAAATPRIGGAYVIAFWGGSRCMTPPLAMPQASHSPMTSDPGAFHDQSGTRSRVGGASWRLPDAATQWSGYRKEGAWRQILVNCRRRLWEAADQLRANSGLKASEYAAPVLGLIFLRYADERFAKASETVGHGSARRRTGPEDYQAAGALYLPEDSRFETLLNLSEEADIGKAINQAMGGIEVYNSDLQGVLPRDYSRIPDHILAELLRLLRTLPEAIEGDGFGLIYEYFLGNFAFAEGQKGGEFFTPTSIVRLIVEILEPFHGKIYDPACGSGGMFVQSAHFVERHRHDPGEELSIYGQEKTGDTVKLAKMNLAVHGLGGDIREGNTYYEDLHDSVGKFDFVMANPPFNVDKIDKTKLEDDPRFPFGLPRADNGNYIWIQTFYSALNATRTGGIRHGQLRVGCAEAANLRSAAS